uniref:Follicle cell protein 3C-1 n=1 Tax=Cacopsylla melanoneura TaxID=428564 RepID=A0A8D8X9M6_9HEMI
MPEDEEEIERETTPPPVQQQQMEERIVEEEEVVVPEPRKSDEPVACTCGIFMSGQFQKASKAPPKGNPIVMTEMEETYQCNPMGNKQCINKCLEMVSEPYKRNIYRPILTLR